MSTFFICLTVLLLGSMGFIVLVSCLPEDNPLRRVLGCLMYRLAATAGVAVIDVPALGVPLIGEVFDVLTIVGLVWYWATLIPEMRVALAPPPRWHDADYIDHR